MVRFLAEISTRSDVVIHPTPSNNFDKAFDVYEIDISPHPTEATYWTEWGGYYDNFTGTQIELYYSQFLMTVNTLDEIFYTPFSLFITDDLMVLINIPKHPWLYPDYSVQSSHVVPFLSSALDPGNPSKNTVRDVPAAVRLGLPDFTVKLSDNISGVTLNQSFSISLKNNDGYFDDEKKWNLFNTPVHLKKAVVENPQYEDFKVIRNGLVDTISTSFDNLIVNVSDRLMAMSNPVCSVIEQALFPNSPITNDRALGKTIPIVYGTKRIRLQMLNPSTFLAAEFVADVHGVYDRDGEPVPFTFNQANYLITANEGAETAEVTGYRDNKIGKIITDIITRKTDVQFNNSNWNLDETERYTEISAPVNTVIQSGDVRRAVQRVLKNDMAFFIQQIDGRFTIRRYGENYTLHEIPAWVITQARKPEKIWGNASVNYFSSCIVNYDFIDDSNFKSYVYSERESEAENNFRRILRKTFDTELIYKEDARKLAVLLSDRYTAMMPTIKLPLGVDTINFELLDTVSIRLDINERAFSKETLFIIKEINPAQDIITLESIELLNISGEYPETVDYEADYDNMFPETSFDEFELVIDGGVV